MPQLLKTILFVYPNWIIFVPLVVATINFRKYRPELRYLTFYLALSATAQVVSFIYWRQSKNNYPILHIYTPMEYVLLFLFYLQLLKGYLPKLLINLLLLFIPIFSLIDSLLLEEIYTSNTYSRSLEALVIIALAIIWYIKIVSMPEEERHEQSGINFINAGLLVYFSGSIVLFSYSSYISKMTYHSSQNLWTIHSLLTAQLYVLITIGLWKTKTT
jgi:hypothetical protein